MSQSLQTTDNIHLSIIDSLFNKGRSIFLSGPGGTGKSYIIKNVIKKTAVERGIPISLTSTTGVSAIGIEGTTIHRWSGIGLGKEPYMVICSKIKSKKEVTERWRNTRILVIDEISMMGIQTFSLLDRVAKHIRGDKNPFGGLQLVLSGDFLQLPPVNDDFCFKSIVWNNLNMVYYKLSEPKRYPDIEHFNMLLRARSGECTNDDFKILKNRVQKYIDYIGSGGERKDIVKPTRIFSLKKDVEKYNLEQLSKIEGQEYRYECIDKITKLIIDSKKVVEQQNTDSNTIKTIDKEIEDINNGIDTLDVKDKDVELSKEELEECVVFLDSNIPKTLIFKKGAQVMLTYNIDIDNGLVNGSRGVVEKCEPDGVVVKFRNGIETMIGYNKYEFKESRLSMSRLQVPLILCWATSIHKCIAPNTLIATVNGLMRIEDISSYQINRTVKIFQQEDTSLELDLEVYGLNEKNKATQIYRGKIVDTIKIKTSRGYTIEGSHNHPLMKNNDEFRWAEMMNLIIGDKIILQAGTNSNSDTHPFIVYENTVITIDLEVCYIIGCLLSGEYRENSLFIEYVNGKFKDFKIRDTELNTVELVEKIFLSQKIEWYILQNTKDGHLDFIKGFIDCCGVEDEKYLIFYCKDSICEDIQVLLLNYGVVSFSKKDSSTSRSSILIESNDYIFLNNLLFDRETKIENFDFKDSIVSIEHSKSRVFDIFVPVTNSFIGNGIYNHNSQGATLDYAIMDLGSSIFSPGMAYVALSRVRTIEGLMLSGFLPNKIYSDKLAIEFENKLLECSLDEKENVTNTIKRSVKKNIKREYISDSEDEVEYE